MGGIRTRIDEDEPIARWSMPAIPQPLQSDLSKSIVALIMSIPTVVNSCHAAV
jgi:hypothetical protein